MQKITEREFKACYQLGKQVYDGMHRADAVGELVDKYGMKEGSAGPYIQAFLSMMKGGELNWSVGQGYLRYYFENALIDYGKEQIKISLECLEKHIEYHGNNKRPSEVPGLRTLYNEYSGKVGSSKRL